MRKKILSLSIFAFLVSGTSFVSAQTCGAGFELREVVNIDFGTFSSENERSCADAWLNMGSIGCDSSGDVANGSYAVVANPEKSGTGWAVNGIDHTTQTANYPAGTYGGMLFVNGMGTNSILFEKTITVCPDANLSFEAWFANAHDDKTNNLPKLRFEVLDKNDNVLDFVNSQDQVGDANPNPNDYLISPNNPNDTRWKKVTMNFNSGLSNTSLKLRIWNVTADTDGNDYVIDDIKVTVCVPIINPEWGDNLGAETSIVKVECESAASLREIPISLNETESAGAQANGLTWFVWQYSDNSGTTWNNFGAVEQTTSGNYSKNVEKAAPSGQREWRLVLATTQQEANDIADGKIIATGCSSGTVTSSIIFECLPVQVPDVILSTDKTVTCIQDGNEMITLTAKIVNIDKEDNWVIDENNSNIDYIWLENGIEKNDWKNQLTIERPIVAPSGIYTYKIRAEKSTGNKESNEVSVKINDPMLINIVARDEANNTLVDKENNIDKLTAIKRNLLLTVETSADPNYKGGYPNHFEWNNGFISNINELPIAPAETTTYNVTASDETGCSATAEITINVKPLPTAFVPVLGEGDRNSVFPVSADARDQQDVIEYQQMDVFNRYGQEVYSGNRRWDGTINGNKLAEPGTYFYIITFYDGEIIKGTIEVIKK